MLSSQIYAALMNHLNQSSMDRGLKDTSEERKLALLAFWTHQNQ